MFEITFLGTSASAPSMHRGLSAQVVKHNEHRFLIDCGEGTQRQILRSGLGFKRLNRVLITHGHLDHILGLGGLFSTFSRWDTIDEIEIWAGRWALERIDSLLYGVRIVPPNHLSAVKINMRVVQPGVIIEEDDFTVTAMPVKHRGPDCFGYIFEEKSRRPFLPEKAEALGVHNGPLRGKLVKGEEIMLEDGTVVKPEDVLGKDTPGTKLVITGDHGKPKKIIEHVRGADCLVSEATYIEEEVDMAKEFMHLTAKQAAEMARDAEVGKLLLTHLSRRYRERDVRDEAVAIFPNTTIARDFDTYQVRPGVCEKVDG